MRILVIIPARGGSKGLPGKNVKILNGKPLICYSIDIARQMVCDTDICVSTDDQTIISVVEDYGLHVPFIRPSALASDTASTNDVLIHALSYYQQRGVQYDVVLLLQPTSPLRTINQVKEALELYNQNRDVDMVVSVTQSHAAAVMSHENEHGFLEPTINLASGPRQCIGQFYEYNGAIYVINVNSLKAYGIPNFTKRLKYVMPQSDSFDIDNALDWLIVETIIKNK